MKPEKLNCIILDDEKNCLEVLAIEIKKVKPELEILSGFSVPEEALSFLASNKVDILFLDIELPRMNAFQFLDQLKELPTNIIFTTAYDHYAIKAFRYFAVDYLLKPIERELLSLAINRAYERQRQLDKQLISEIYKKIQAPNSVFTKIAVPVEHGFQMVTIHDIVKCVADSNYSEIHRVGQSKILVSKPLKYLESLLHDHGFIRIHQSYLINVNYIDSYSRQDGGIVQLSDSSMVTVARSRKSMFETFLSDHKYF